MPVEIKGLPVTVLKNPKEGPQVQQPGRNQPSAAQEETAKPASSDTVSLTDTPARLRELQHSLASQPVVDSKRVETVKAVVANGNYHVDSARVADKLVRFERELSGK
ncbi:MAG TPA: flagellar biosynthesis anti-sigma factor FlgM [Gammaproteobacteria bacterium]|nr:flagellar biosynthesis anti-sigma factor FlgM [Gammaproteobacteria bacterium]